MPSLTRHHVGGVTLLTDGNVGGGVTFAFTEREGGVSEGPYASLNLGASCGDDASLVAENRRRALAAIGAGDLVDNLVSPRQVHGERIVCVGSSRPEDVRVAQEEAAAGADAIVCTACDVPVLLCYADCVPVVLTCPGGFAVVHSGWRGTIARIAGKAVRALCREAGARADEVSAYVGPHILGQDYEVSEELAARFVGEFGERALSSPRHLDLSACVGAALAEAGVGPERVAWCDVSTARATDRFFSYRAQGGECGRHGACAVRRCAPQEPSADGTDTDKKREATLR